MQNTDATNSPIERDLSVSLASANLKSIIFALPPVMLVFGLHVLLWGRPHLSLTTSVLLPLLGFVFVGFVLHEAIHGIAWAVWGTRSFAAIKFGMNIRALAPYAHATVPMKASAYRLGAISPAFVLGVLPSFAGLITGNFLVTFYGMIFLAAAAGDFLVLWLIRNVPSTTLVVDHPTRAGCMVRDPDAPVGGRP